MCGIFGIYKKNNSTIDLNIKELSSLLNHRGPDEFGYYKNDNCILANNRLSIIDIENGSQPFYSKDKKIIVVQNGEIYNFKKLKLKLKKKGISFSSNSDTEVILKLYEFYGIKFIKYLEGIFSIIIHDNIISKSFFIRDRFGEKPLFFFESDEYLIVSSEIRVIKKIFKLRINIDSVISYLRHNYIHGPKTIYKNIFHVDNGNYISYSHDTFNAKSHSYFNLIQEISKGKNVSKNNFIESVDNKTISDVGYSVLLSGGIDSSALISQLHNRVNFNTYSILFEDNKFDESDYVKEISKKLNIDINFIKYNFKNIKNEISETQNFQEQPHGDSSFLALKKICEEVSKYEKVTLSGDGADEIFGGYDYYFKSNKEIKNQILKNQIFSDEEINKLLLSDINFENEKLDILNDINYKFIDYENSLMLIDTLSLLPYNNFIKCDRMSMASSLELRTPFISKDLVINALFTSTKLKSSFENRKHFMKDNLLDKKI